SHADIDFAVVDLVLPDMHGVEVIRKLVAIDRHVRILVATGLNPEDAREALKAGALDVIPKPYSISNLRDRLQRFSPATVVAGADA
ncbi:MAG: response regulator, partial [Armatimonadota bacterium]